MRALTESEFEREAKPAYVRAFNSSSPFDEPFSAAITSRVILFPVHYIMDKRLARALKNAAKHLNESSFFLSVLERPPAVEQDRPYHWQIGFNELDQYNSLGYPFVLENAIYSVFGTWGLMFSHEHHAVLGGPVGFVRDITQTLPDKQVDKFLEAWKRNKQRFSSDLDWLPPLLRHVYGDEQEQRLMVKAGLRASREHKVPPSSNNTQDAGETLRSGRWQ